MKYKVSKQSLSLLSFIAVFSFFYNIDQSAAKNSTRSSIGVLAGVSLDLPKNFFTEADAFSNYYGGNVINYNYGTRGILGYKILGASVYGLAGLQHSGFASGESNKFKESVAPVYGFGVGYNFPLINMGLRLENTYFSLDKKDGSKYNFNGVNFGFGFVI